MKVPWHRGPAKPDASYVRVLSWGPEWRPDEIRYYADQGHGKEVARARGLAESKAAVTPGVSGRERGAEDGEKLGASDARPRRWPAAKSNFAARGKPGAQYATKRVCREMSDPTVGAFRGLYRSTRYVCGTPRIRL